MKKTLTANLSGTVYHIDEDAYKLLDSYLMNLRQHFNSEAGGEEIVRDIEQRISELFDERLHGGSQMVVTIDDAEEVISRMGQPEEFDGGGSTTSNTEDESKTEDEDKNEDAPEEEPVQSSRRSRKRLFRNPDDKVLGGVASGMAAYFNWDPTFVRLGIVLLTIFSQLSILPVYLILWLVVPLARTAADKLAMHGEDVTVENIGKTVTSGFDKVKDYTNSPETRSTLQRIADALIAIIGFLMKIFLIVVGGFVTFLCIVVLGSMLALVLGLTGLFSFVRAMTGIPFYNWGLGTIEASTSTSPSLLVVGATLLLAGLPLYALVYAILRRMFDWKPLSKAAWVGIILVWTLTFVACLIGGCLFFPFYACGLTF